MTEQEILQQFKTDFPYCHKAKIVKRLDSNITSLRFQCANLNDGKMIELSEVAKQIGELYSIVSDGGNGLLVEIRLNQDKELANWIYYEEGHTYYCFDCVERRMREINDNKEFADSIDYESGEECGYFQDYADEDYEVVCCKCGKPLFSTGVDC